MVKIESPLTDSLASRDPAALLDYIRVLQTTIELSERDHEVQRAVYRIAEIATSAEDIEAFYAALHDIVKELTSTDAFFIATYHDDQQCVSFPYYEDKYDDAQNLDSLPLRNRSLIPVEELSHSMTWRVISSNEPVRIVQNPTEQESAYHKPEGVGIGRVAHDWLGFPLRQNGVPVGVVSIQSYEPGFRYADSEVEMMVFMANHIGTALQRRRDSFSLKQAHADLQSTAKQLELANLALTEEIHEKEKIGRRVAALSHEAGKAEVATGVLHNVGNVLNSINVSANLVQELQSQSRLSSLRKMAELIHEQEDLVAFFEADPRARAVPDFLSGVVERLEDNQEQVLCETKKLIEHVNHVKVVVATQQSLAGVSGLKEPVCLFKLFNDAELLLADSMWRHEINLTYELEELSEVMLERQRILQVVVNLLKNAKDALSLGRKEDRRLIVRSFRDGDRLQLEVEDNGIGVAEENLAKIFSHGFTTKEDGHGFGLHSCANTINEMGGRMSVTSEGVGLGATFMINVPFIEASTYVGNCEEKFK